MFGKTDEEKTIEKLKLQIKDLKDDIQDYRKSIREMELNQELEVKEIKHAHSLELLTKQFEIEHKTDGDKDTLNKKVQELEKTLGIVTKEKEMLEKIVDISADIIDIKELVKTLIQKIPTIDIKSLNVTSSDTGSRSTDKK